jgi:hypothetical protein
VREGRAKRVQAPSTFVSPGSDALHQRSSPARSCRTISRRSACATRQWGDALTAPAIRGPQTAEKPWPRGGMRRHRIAAWLPTASAPARCRSAPQFCRVAHPDTGGFRVAEALGDLRKPHGRGMAQSPQVGRTAARRRRAWHPAGGAGGASWRAPRLAPSLRKTTSPMPSTDHYDTLLLGATRSNGTR